MSPHRSLTSATGLRPMSAFVVVATVVLAVATWVTRLSQSAAPQPTRLRQETTAPPAYSIVSSRGETIARFAPRFDLELSPRSLWQAHTPRRIACALSEALGGSPDPDELLARMLPDARDGVIQVRDWTLTRLQTQRLHDWIESGAGSGLGRLAGIEFEPAGPGSYRLSWRPEQLLSEQERERHGVTQAWRWARRLADGLDRCLFDRSGEEPRLVSESEAEERRARIWKALLPSAQARAVEGLAPDTVVRLREALDAQGVAGWQMRISYARDRVYPAGRHELFGSWGFVGEGALEPAPREGLELLCDRLLGSRACAFLERRPEHYTWRGLRPVRGQRVNGYIGYEPASEPPTVETTLDLGLQAFLGRELRATLEQHDAALAMGIVLDVQSGEILAVDSAEAYPVQPFAPVYHVFTTGSTFKVLTMAVALEEGVVTPDSPFDVGQGECRIYYPDGTPTSRTIHEAEGALTGHSTAARFFAYSVNGALAQIGLRVPDTVFHDYLERLGYGRPPGAGLGPERAGLLTPLPWKYAYTHASVGFGHEISSTVWQHAAALATVVRGGVFRPLTLLRGVRQGERTVDVPPAPDERIFSEKTCALVRDMMRLGAHEGTGKEVRAAFARSVAARIGSDPEGAFDLGSKTGTAEKVPTELCVHLELGERARWEREGLPATRERVRSLARLAKPHSRCYTSSICLFGSVKSDRIDSVSDEREVMVLVVVEEPRGKERFGSRVAGPCAQRVLAEALGISRNGSLPCPDLIEGFGASTLALEPSSARGPWPRSAP